MICDIATIDILDDNIYLPTNVKDVFNEVFELPDDGLWVRIYESPQYISTFQVIQIV